MKDLLSLMEGNLKGFSFLQNKGARSENCIQPLFPSSLYGVSAPQEQEWPHQLLPWNHDHCLSLSCQSRELCLWACGPDLQVLCASVSKMCLKVIPSSLFAILTYERFHRNVLDITLLTKICIVNAMVFLIVMYGYESWTIKKAKHWRIDAFELRW